MSVSGRLLRATVFRPYRVRRVPFGIGRGIKLVVEPDAPLHKYIGTAEIELSRHIRAFAQPGMRCFDIGGYDAHIAMALARLTSAQVCCFEVSEERVHKIRRNLALNPLLAQHVQLIATRVGNETNGNPRIDRLDDLIASEAVFVPDFVKIDVEGAEMEVLAGAAKLLREHKPHLVVEIHSARLAVECLVQLEDMGYQPRPTIVHQRKLLSENRGDELNEWVVAVGRDGFERKPKRRRNPTSLLNRSTSTRRGQN